MRLKSTLIASTAGLSLLLAGSAYAFQTDTSYIGASLGYGYLQKNDYSDTTYTVVNTDNKGFAGGFYVGYQMSRLLNVRFGATYFGQNKANVTQSSTTTNLTRTYYDVDAMILATLPFGHSGSQLYVGGGAAYVFSNGSGSFLASASNTKRNASWWRPKVTAGVDFTLSGNFAIGASYAYVFGSGSVGDYLSNNNAKFYLPNLSLASVNLSYAFSAEDL